MGSPVLNVTHMVSFFKIVDQLITVSRFVQKDTARQSKQIKNHAQIYGRRWDGGYRYSSSFYTYLREIEVMRIPENDMGLQE